MELECQAFNITYFIITSRNGLAGDGCICRFISFLRFVEYKILIFKSVCLWLIIFHFDNTKIKEDRQNNHASNMYFPTGGIYEKFIFWQIRIEKFLFFKKTHTHTILSIALWIIFFCPRQLPPITFINLIVDLENFIANTVIKTKQKYIPFSS